MFSFRKIQQKKITSFFGAVLAVIVFIGLGLQGNPAIALDVGSEQDIAGPQIASFDLSPAAVDVRVTSASITANAHLTDDLSGVATVRVFYRSPTGAQSQTFTFHSSNRVSGTALDGQYTTSISLDTQQEAGTWQVNSATTTDAVGNIRGYSAADTKALGANDFTVQSNRDATPPAVTAVRWSPSPLDLSTADGFPTFEWDATDEGGSGLYYVNISLRSPSGRQRISGQGVDFTSTIRSAHTFTAVGTTTTNTGTFGFGENGISQYSEPGNWTIDYVQVRDRANNLRTYTGAALAALLPGPFVVTADPADAVEPVLSAYRFSPAAIDVSSAAKTVNIEFDVSDELSGVQAAWITFRSPYNPAASPQSLHRSGTYNQYLSAPVLLNGTVSASVVFPVYDRSGDWVVEQVCVVDQVKHQVCFEGTDLAGLGPVALTVIANEPPSVSVTGVQDGAIYQSGFVPAAACDVRDREDGVIAAVQPVVSGPDSQGTYTVTCSYTDAGGKSGAAEASYTVERPTNTPPGVAVAGVTASTYEVGSEPTPSCTVTDAEDTDAAAAPVVGAASGGHGLGARTVTCTFTDSGGLTGTASVTYTVVDTGLPGLAGAPTTQPNGAGWYREDVTIHWTASDSGAGIDPSTVPADDVLNADGAGQTRTASVDDLAGNSATAVSAPAVNLDKTAPTASAPVFTVNPKATNQTTNMTVTAGDSLSGVAGGEYFLENDPGQGNATPLLLSADGTRLTRTLGTTLSPGVYTIGVRSVDRAGNWSAVATELLVVYDPSGGFVTGGGHINSPAGAYAADPSATGKATFGFVSKYQKGASAPTGSTEFQFQAGNLNFASSSYEWLVVAGARAQYKGSGTVNGIPGYKFLLTAIDGAVNGGGGVDKFRIKITKDGVVVYDNNLGASDDLANAVAVTGGSIVVHSK